MNLFRALLTVPLFCGASLYGQLFVATGTVDRGEVPFLTQLPPGAPIKVTLDLAHAEWLSDPWAVNRIDYRIPEKVTIGGKSILPEDAFAFVSVYSGAFPEPRPADSDGLVVLFSSFNNYPGYGGGFALLTTTDLPDAPFLPAGLPVETFSSELRHGAYSDVNGNWFEFTITGYRIGSHTLTPVPEPSGYAATAGLALIGWVLTRRKFAPRALG